ncbi:MAG: hypothetical protein AB8E15_07985 [Bdellovibrionales bacterium]
MNSTISFETSEFGLVPKKGNRRLCSVRNPIKEAKTWVGRQVIHSDTKLIVVLGLAGGYHIDELCLRYPKTEIVVIEAEFQIASKIKLKNKPIRVYTSIENILRSDLVERFYDLNNVQIIEHNISVSENSKFYNKAIASLTARTPAAFKSLMKNRFNEDLSDVDLGSALMSVGANESYIVERGLKNIAIKKNEKMKTIFHLISEVVK